MSASTFLVALLALVVLAVVTRHLVAREPFGELPPVPHGH
jgi:hypothetical protein